MDAQITDKRWFQDQFRDKKTSARQIAKAIGIEPSAFSLMLSGRRKMQLTEATEIARILGVTLSEVVARAGIDTRGTGSENAISVPTPSGRVVRVELPAGLARDEWEVVAKYLGQFLKD